MTLKELPSPEFRADWISFDHYFDAGTLGAEYFAPYLAGRKRPPHLLAMHLPRVLDMSRYKFVVGALPGTGRTLGDFLALPLTHWQLKQRHRVLQMSQKVVSIASELPQMRIVSRLKAIRRPYVFNTALSEHHCIETIDRVLEHLPKNSEFENTLPTIVRAYYGLDTWTPLESREFETHPGLGLSTPQVNSAITIATKSMKEMSQPHDDQLPEARELQHLLSSIV